MHTIYCGLIRDFILYVALITLSIVVGFEKICIHVKILLDISAI